MDYRHALWLVGPLLLALAARLLAGAHGVRLSSGPPPVSCRRWVQVERPGSGLVCLDSRPASRLLTAGVSRGCLRHLYQRGASLDRLRPGDAVRAPHSARCQVARMAPAKIKTLGIPVDLNTANIKELLILPGVGPRLARRIILHRRRKGSFASPEDLLRVKGVGPRLLARLRPHLLPSLRTH